jgi:hypothetical protein
MNLTVIIQVPQPDLAVGLDLIRAPQNKKVAAQVYNEIVDIS